MTARGFYTLLFGACLLVTALSVSSAGAFLLGAAALLALAVSLLSVLTAMLTCRISQDVTGLQAVRGGACRYSLRVFMIAPLPIAPLSLTVSLPSGRKSEFALAARLFGATQSDNEFTCPHVGVFPVGVVQAVFSDCFGLFSFRTAVKEPAAAVTVLPDPRETAPLQYSPGEGETSAAQRSQADRTTPTDTRVWQEGDELGRVHWKLSMRRQELTESDERIRMMAERARSWAFSLTVTIAGIAVIVLSLLGKHDAALPFSWFVGAMVALYWICWLIIRRKY